MHAIGVDIGGTKISAGLVDEDGAVLAKAQRKTAARAPGEIERRVVELVKELGDGSIAAVGVAAAGFVSADRSSVLFAPNIAWRDYPLRERLEGDLGVKVVVENDANAAGWAEFQFGAAQDVADMVMLTVGTGLGGAIVSDGRLLRGAFGVAGEIGHLRLVPDGHFCGCGHEGCWERYASGSSLVRDTHAAITRAEGEAAAITELAGGKEISGKHVTKAANAGDPLARRLLERVGTRLGEGMASLAAILDPAMFVVGGGVVAAGELLLGPAREAFAEHLSARGFRPEAHIVAAQAGNDAGIVGAADLARR